MSNRTYRYGRPHAPALRLAGSALFLLAVAVLAGAEEGEGQAQVAMGQNTFRVYCASCHGVDGEGDGQVSPFLSISPADLTTIAERNEGVFPAEEVRQRIDGREKVRGHGSKDMPVWGDALLKTARAASDAEVVDRIAELVAFVESIQTEPATD